MNLAQRVGQEFKALRDNELALKADKATTLSGYGITDAYTKTESNTALSNKQNTLVSGTNIKTINGNSILGSGDLVISGSGGSSNISMALISTQQIKSLGGF